MGNTLMMDCCRIITMVRCGSFSIVALIVHQFEPQRTLPGNNENRNIAVGGVPASVNFGILPTLLNLPERTEFEDNMTARVCCYGKHIDDGLLPDYYNGALRQFFNCCLNCTSV